MKNHEFQIERGYKNFPERKILELEYPEMEARIALAMLERWGMICAEIDGEDSAGRQKARLMSPEELTTRAFTCAALAMKTMRDGGLLIRLPTEEEADAILKERENKRENSKTK